MKELVLKWLFASGLNVTRHIELAEVRDFVRKLRPQECGMELIRIGTDGDGGYLIPDDLEGIKYCFSPGVSTKSDFENQLADRGIRSFLADYSVDYPSINRPEFTFDKKFLGAADRREFFTLGTWKDKHLAGYEGDLILQMDIEGFEYQVLLNASEDLLKQFRIVVIEFHFLNRIFDRFTFGIISSCFDKLLEHFHLVHIHPNNCCGCLKKGNIEIPGVIECTFIRKDRASYTQPQTRFPHRLDITNVPTNPPLPLPKCWYAEQI